VSRRRLPNRLRLIEDQKAQGESRALEKFQTREWKAGDIYSPHDLSPAEMKKWGKRKGPSRDAFDALNMDPLSLYKVRKDILFPSPSLWLLRINLDLADTPNFEYWQAPTSREDYR